jgi:hypothetical protein
MRQIIRTSAIVLAVACIFGAPVKADMTGVFSDSYGSGPGGEFLFTPTGDYNGLTLEPFSTFCLEKNEMLDFGSVFNVADISGAANNGGLAGGNPDPLDERTAWLYSSFVDGSLASLGYDYGTGSDRIASADALQEVIWAIEDERDSKWPAGSLEETFYTAAGANADGLGGVRVLNVEWLDGTPAQSQLVLVPVPGAVLLGALGLGFVGLVKRRLG